MKCPKCGFESPDGSKFCAQCGNKLEKNRYSNNCPICGNQFEGNFCPECGTKAEKEEQSTPNQGYRINQGKSKVINSLEKVEKEKWYQKTWVVILLTIFIWPVGLFLMWKYKKEWGKVVKIIITVIAILVFGAIQGSSDDSDSTKVVTESKTNNKNQIQKKEGVQGTEVLKNNINEFSTEIVDGKIILEKYNGNEKTLIISPSYDVNGETLTTDLSNFQVSSNNVENLILCDGITEINTSIFNGSDVAAIYFPKSLTTVYDYTLAYLHPNDGKQIKVYYAGTQGEWKSIFKHYERKKVEDSIGNEPAEDVGKALADKVNDMTGVAYNASDFIYYFSSEPEDITK